MLNEVQMNSQARIIPQLLLNGNHCLNEGESMHIIKVMCKLMNQSLFWVTNFPTIHQTKVL